MLLDILGKVVVTLAYFQLHDLEHQLFGGGRQVLPHQSLLFPHQTVHRLGDHRRRCLQEVVFDRVHVYRFHHSR